MEAATRGAEEADGATDSEEGLLEDAAAAEGEGVARAGAVEGVARAVVAEGGQEEEVQGGGTRGGEGCTRGSKGCTRGGWLADDEVERAWVEVREGEE